MKNILELDSHSNAEGNLIHLLCTGLLIVPFLYLFTNLGRLGGFNELKFQVLFGIIVTIILLYLLISNMYYLFSKLNNVDVPKFVQYNENDNSIITIDYKSTTVIKLEDIVEIKLKVHNGGTTGNFFIRKNNRNLWDKISDNLLIEKEVNFKMGEFQKAVDLFTDKNINVYIN